MCMTFFEVRSILDSQRDQVRIQPRIFSLDDLPPLEIGRESLSAPPDGTQRTEQMLATKKRTMELHLVNREVVPKHQVGTAIFDFIGNLLVFADRFHIIGNIER